MLNKQKQMIDQETPRHFIKKRYPSVQITTASRLQVLRSLAGSRGSVTPRQQKVTSFMHLNKNQKQQFYTGRKTQNSMHFQYAEKNFSALSKVQRYAKNDFSIDQLQLQKKQNLAGTSMKDYRRKMLRKSVLSSLKTKNNQSIFLRKVEQLQYQFVQYCLKESYDQAITILVDLLNYTIDLNLPVNFSRSLKILAEFYLYIDKISESLFYFNEARYCGLLLSHNLTLIESLIGMSKCCSKVDLQQQAIKVLKKALEYAWLFDKKQLQLLIYDEIGKKYYHMGKIQIAKQYHLKYINSIYQPSNSALKSISKQRVLKNLQLFSNMRYSDLDTLFLAHLKLPIKKLSQLAPIVDQNQSFVRQKINYNQKYFSFQGQIQQEILKILQTWFFQTQLDDPALPTQDWTLPTKLKKFAFIDFKLNQKLKSFRGKIIEKKIDCKRPGVQYKEPIQKKIMKKLKQPGLQDDWFEKMAMEIKRDHQNKLSKIRDPVKIRGYNKATKPSIQLLKQLYNEHFIQVEN